MSLPLLFIGIFLHQIFCKELQNPQKEIAVKIAEIEGECVWG